MGNRPRVIMSGASGLVGTALRQALAATGYEVVQVVRGAASGADQVSWDSVKAGGTKALEPLEGARAAVHLSGASVAGQRWSATYKRVLHTSRVDTARALATTLAGLHHRPEVLLAASAAGFYGNRGDEPLDETSIAGRGFLAELCRAWEGAVQPALDAGLRVVHLRFGVVLAREGGALAKMLPAFRFGAGGRLGSGRQWMSWVALEDTIRAILFAMECKEMTGAVNITAPQPVTNAQFTRALAKVLHRPALLPVPAFALRSIFGEMADEALLASARVYPGKLANASFKFLYPRVNEALSAALLSGGAHPRKQTNLPR